LPLRKNDIPNILDLKYLHFHSRTHKISSGCDIVLWYHKKIRPLILGRNCSYPRLPRP